MSKEEIEKQIEEISKQIKCLQLQVKELEQTALKNKKEEESNRKELTGGATVIYTRQPGTTLDNKNAYNPRGTIIRTTNCYVYIETVDGNQVKRAHKNVKRLS